MNSHNQHRATYDISKYNRVDIKAAIVTLMQESNLKPRQAYNMFARQNLGRVVYSIDNYDQIRTHLWRKQRQLGLKPMLPQHETDLGMNDSWLGQNIYARPGGEDKAKCQRMLYQCPKFPGNYYFVSFAQLRMCKDAKIIMMDGTQKTKPHIANHRYPWKQVFTIHIGVEGEYGACKLFLGMCIS